MADEDEPVNAVITFNTPKVSWIYLFLILLISTGSQIQRFVLPFAFGYTVDTDNPDPSKYEIKLSYPKLVKYYGVVSGVLFALPLSVTGIFVGALIPRINRKYFLAIASIIWSVFTFL